MTAIGLALLCAVCWGVADFVAGLASRRLSALLVLLAQQAIGVAIVGAVIIAVGEGPPDGRAIALSILAGVTGAVALGAFYRALAIGTMSIVAPVSASGVTLPVLVGVLSGERPGTLQAAGLAITVVGVVLASREAGDGGAARARRRSIALALVAAVGLGTFFSLADSAAEDSVLWLLVLSRGTAVVVLAGALATAGGLAVPPRRQLGALASIGALDLMATGLYALATTQGLLAVVAVVSSLYPVMTVLLARAVLAERLVPTQAAGVALALTGVAAVAAGGA